MSLLTLKFTNVNPQYPEYDIFDGFAHTRLGGKEAVGYGAPESVQFLLGTGVKEYETIDGVGMRIRLTLLEPDK